MGSSSFFPLVFSHFEGLNKNKSHKTFPWSVYSLKFPTEYVVIKPDIF